MKNSTWGDDRIQGALNNPGYTIDDQTVGDILKRNDLNCYTERWVRTAKDEILSKVISRVYGAIRGHLGCFEFLGLTRVVRHFNKKKMLLPAVRRYS